MWTANQPPNALWWRGLQLAHTETLLSYETVLGLNAISKNEQRLHSIAPDTCTPRMKEAEEVHTPKRRKTMAHPFPPHFQHIKVAHFLFFTESSGLGIKFHDRRGGVYESRDKQGQIQGQTGTNSEASAAHTRLSYF